MRVGPPHGQILELFAHAEGYTVARTTVGLPSAPQDGQELKCSLRLRPAHTLQGLYLDGCRLGEKGVEALTASLKTNTALQALNLEQCGKLTGESGGQRTG